MSARTDQAQRIAGFGAVLGVLTTSRHGAAEVGAAAQPTATALTLLGAIVACQIIFAAAWMRVARRALGGVVLVRPH